MDSRTDLSPLASSSPSGVEPPRLGSRRQWLAGMAAGATALALPFARGHAAATNSTAAPDNITIVIGFPPGGGADALGRLIGERLKQQYQNVVVENRPGAGSQIALAHVSRAKKDGSVLIVAPDFALTIHPHLYPQLQYDPLSSFSPISLGATSGIALSVGPLVPEKVRTIQDFAQWVRDNPRAGLYGTAAVGSTMDFVGRLFALSAGIPLTHVPYQGGMAALQDVIGGQLPAAITGVLEPYQHAQGGRVRVLATTADSRAKLYPEVPTFLEAGYPDVVVLSWYGVLGPAGIPAETQALLNQSVSAALQQPEVVSSVGRLGLDAVSSTPQGLQDITQRDSDRWSSLIRRLDFKLEG